MKARIGLIGDHDPTFPAHATLFQPERAALAGRLPPMVVAFVRASAAHAAGQQHAADAATHRC